MNHPLKTKNLESLMKKQYLIFFIAIFLFNQIAQGYKQQQWNAQEYAQGNKLQYQASLSFLDQNHINIHNRYILDVGCGTGNITAFFALHAAHVHGIDASKDMINYAQSIYGVMYQNLSFQQSFIEDFKAYNTYDLVTSFFAFQWFEDQHQALINISGCLKKGGELIATISTQEDPTPHRATIGLKLIEEFFPESQQQSTSEKLGRKRPKRSKVKAMLEKAGFEIITCDVQSTRVTFASRTEIEDFNRPVIMSRPFIQNASDELREAFFNSYIDEILPGYERTESGEFIENVTITIIHTRKK